MDMILFQHLNMENQLDKTLYELIQKGYVEYCVSEVNGELLFSLTEDGHKKCNEIFKEGD